MFAPPIAARFEIKKVYLMMRRLWLPFLTCCLLFPLAARCAEKAALLAALESITTDDLRTHVDILADDTFEGRESGSRGGRAAGVYITKELAKLGLQPAGVNGSWYQPFYNNQQNILGRIEGSDPKLKDQVVLVAAHYDHVGYGSSTNSYGPIGYIHNGADDNASGVAGLLEVAQAIASLEVKPRRTVVFAFWDGEEKGLLGSRYWLSHPTVALNKIALDINIDMIGRLRDRKLEVAGTRSSWGLRRLVCGELQADDMLLDFTWELKSNSDHWPFFEHGIPILMLHTGLHNDYHRPSDDTEKINREGMEQVSRLLFRIVYTLADADEIGTFRAASRRDTPDGQRRLEQPLSPEPPRLGVTWDEAGQGPGVVLTRVVAGSPAERAGMRTGDRLLRVNDRELPNGEMLRSLLAGAQSPIRCELARPGDDKPVQLEVALDGAPTRVGISWREDDAEPGTLLLVRVVLGSPAYRAGLQVGDRIYAISGAQFSGSRDFTSRIADAEGPTELLVERRGRIEPRTVELPPIADDASAAPSEDSVPAGAPPEAEGRKPSD